MNFQYGNPDAFPALLGIIFVVILVMMFIGFVLSLLGSYSLYVMGKRQKVKYSWIAYIPIAQLYVVGKLVGKFRIYTVDIPKPELVLPVVPLITIVLMGVPVIGYLAVLANAVLMIAAVYFLFRRYKDENTALLYTVLGTIVIFLLPIFLFKIRYTDPVNPEEQ